MRNHTILLKPGLCDNNNNMFNNNNTFNGDPGNGKRAMNKTT